MIPTNVQDRIDYHYEALKILNEDSVKRGRCMANIKLLSIKYDLTSIDDTELATIMEELCNTYIMCRKEMSTATLNVWDCIERVSREIVRRSSD